MGCHFYTQGISEIYWFSIASPPSMRQGYSLLTGEVSDTSGISGSGYPRLDQTEASTGFGFGTVQRFVGAGVLSLPLLRFPACFHTLGVSRQLMISTTRISLRPKKRDSQFVGVVNKKRKTYLATLKRLINGLEVLRSCLLHKLDK